jgi:hypothetical protein
MCRIHVEVNTYVSRSLLTLVHIIYLLLFLFLLTRRSQQALCLGLERGLKPLPNKFRVVFIKINLTTNYQLLVNCNKVHRAVPPCAFFWQRGTCARAISRCPIDVPVYVLIDRVCWVSFNTVIWFMMHADACGCICDFAQLNTPERLRECTMLF